MQKHIEENELYRSSIMLLTLTLVGTFVFFLS